MYFLSLTFVYIQQLLLKCNTFGGERGTVNCGILPMSTPSPSAQLHRQQKQGCEQFSTCIINMNLWCVTTHLWTQTATITLFNLYNQPLSDGEGGSLSSRSSAEDIVPVEGVLGSLRLKSPLAWRHTNTHIRYFHPAEHFSILSIEN